MDITEIILHQHGEQRRMFSHLDEWPRDDVAGLTALWARLEIFLEVHAQCEEEFFYPRLLEVGKGAADASSAAAEVEDSVGDHNEIRAAVRKAKGLIPGTVQWWEAITEANVANAKHMGEEERRDLADFREHASLQERHDIAVQFLRFEAENWAKGVKPVDKDPQEFVK